MRCVVIDHRGNVAARDMTFEDCQTAVGGCVELVRLGDGICMYVSEDGKTRPDLPENRPATYFAHMVGPNIGVFDFIVGVAVLVGLNGDRDLPENGFKLVEELIRRLGTSPRPG